MSICRKYPALKSLSHQLLHPLLCLAPVHHWHVAPGKYPEDTCEMWVANYLNKSVNKCEQMLNKDWTWAQFHECSIKRSSGGALLVKMEMALQLLLDYNFHHPWPLAAVSGAEGRRSPQGERFSVSHIWSKQKKIKFRKH